ncbi:PIN domain-containing protein [Candidatus Acetothermia bacterium]|nr:PIN domain-containing protein [Candidatus Acetothermia bacterium]
MQKVLLDTNVLIDWLNAGKYSEFLFARGLVKYLSAVVLLELEAGAFSSKDRRLVRQLARGFEQVRRIVVPTAADWQEGGRLLRQLQQERDYNLSKAHSLAHDVLIALSARRIGAVVVTQNSADFEAIRQLRSFSLMVV